MATTAICLRSFCSGGGFVKFAGSGQLAYFFEPALRITGKLGRLVYFLLGEELVDVGEGFRQLLGVGSRTITALGFQIFAKTGAGGAGCLHPGLKLTGVLREDHTA